MYCLEEEFEVVLLALKDFLGKYLHIFLSNDFLYFTFEYYTPYFSLDTWSKY